jgi:hypothetical protein
MTSPKTLLAAMLASTVALGGLAVAIPANAVTSQSEPWTDTGRSPKGGHDVFTDGARGTDTRDAFTDGARGTEERDPFTQGG